MVGRSSPASHCGDHKGEKRGKMNKLEGGEMKRSAIFVIFYYFPALEKNSWRVSMEELGGRFSTITVRSCEGTKDKNGQLRRTRRGGMGGGVGELVTLISISFT